MRCAVVGHVEWVEFARVPELPTAGSIVHATEAWAEPAGGGAVVARQIARLAGRCEFFTALGDDELGHEAARQLSTLGIDVHARARRRRRGARWTHVDQHGERTITVLGDKLLPRGPLPLDGYDAVFFVSGDVEALRSARAARLPRRDAARAADAARGRRPARPARRQPATTPGERYDDSLDATIVVLTDGANGGTVERRALRRAPICPARSPTPTARATRSPPRCCFALARGDDVRRRGRTSRARAGAAVITGQGPYTAQLTS